MDPRLFDLYLRGATPFFACQEDQRFSYCLYVPENFDPRHSALVVVVHGTGRMICTYRDAYADFAEKTSSVILFPLFPIGIGDPEDMHGYKRILSHGIRYDLILLSIVEEICEKYGATWKRFYLQGFSGGGQFVHRFFYLHPDRLKAVSIGAPGNVTLLDDNRPWWVGIGDVRKRFNLNLNFAAMRLVNVHMIVGEEDTETWEITKSPEDSTWIDGANDAGRTRIDRLRYLEKSLNSFDIDVEFETIPHLAHAGTGVISPVQNFFIKCISCNSI